MKDETNREIKWVAIVATFFVLASLSSATAQRPIPAPRSQPQDFSAEVFDGPTPFIRFVQTKVDDIAEFNFAQFLIFPKPGSATRPIKVRYARSYLEARGYFDSQTGKLTIPIFGLYAGRANRVTINLRFTNRFHPIKRLRMLITTPAYDGGTYSHPTVVQPRLPSTTLSYDFILLKNLADPTTPIIIDSDAEVRWVGTAGVGVTSCMMFDNAFYLASGTQLLRTEFDGRTYVMADYGNMGVVNFLHNIDPGGDGMNRGSCILRPTFARETLSAHGTRIQCDSV